MSADGVSPASLRAARITETDLQDAEETEPKATLGGVARQIQKASLALLMISLKMAISSLKSQGIARAC